MKVYYIKYLKLNSLNISTPIYILYNITCYSSISQYKDNNNNNLLLKTKVIKILLNLNKVLIIYTKI